jgi:hypothetical protein
MGRDHSVSAVASAVLDSLGENDLKLSKVPTASNHQPDE